MIRINALNDGAAAEMDPGVLVVSLAIAENGKPREFHSEPRFPPQVLRLVAVLGGRVDQAAVVATLLLCMDSVGVRVVALRSGLMSPVASGCRFSREFVGS